MLSPLLYGRLACPVCRGELREEGTALTCPACGRDFPVIDGVPVLLRESAAQPAPRPTGVDVTVLILALNEAENLKLSLAETRLVLDDLGVVYEILVVDGGSQDETVKVARALGATVHVQERRGYGNAFREGLERVRGRYLLTLDADLSHDPNYIRMLWDRRNSCDLVVASRYTAGGEAIMPLSRIVLSRLLNEVCGFLLTIPVKDLSSGFRLYNSAAVKSIQLQGENFDILIELLVKLYSEGYRIEETPMFYKPRGEGQSHVRLAQFAKSYLKSIWRLWRTRNSVLSADYESRAYHSLVWLQRYWQRQRYSIVLRFLGGKTSGVLDAGCGSSKIIQSLPGAVGVDFLLRKLRFLRRIHPTLVNATVLDLPFRDESFETVICYHVSERIPDTTRALSELLRVLKPGGTLILATPDYGTLGWRIIGPIYRRIIPGGKTGQHISYLDRKGLRELLESQGVEMLEEDYVARSEWVGKGRKR